MDQKKQPKSTWKKIWFHRLTLKAKYVFSFSCKVTILEIQGFVPKCCQIINCKNNKLFDQQDLATTFKIRGIWIFIFLFILDFIQLSQTFLHRHIRVVLYTHLQQNWFYIGQNSDPKLLNYGVNPKASNTASQNELYLTIYFYSNTSFC